MPKRQSRLFVMKAFFFVYCQAISICADITMKKGMTLSSSYLGMTGHFFCRLDFENRVVVLVRILAHPHTAEHIRVT